MNESVLVGKAEKFAIRIVNLYKMLCFQKRETVMSKQLLRCGTSIGANVSEAQCAQTKPDFVTKMFIAYKECNETMYWLRLLHNTDYLTEREYTSINDDCVELFKLLTSTTKTANKRKDDNLKQSSDKEKRP